MRGLLPVSNYARIINHEVDQRVLDHPAIHAVQLNAAGVAWAEHYPVTDLQILAVEVDLVVRVVPESLLALLQHETNGALPKTFLDRASRKDDAAAGLLGLDVDPDQNAVAHQLNLRKIANRLNQLGLLILRPR